MILLLNNTVGRDASLGLPSPREIFHEHAEIKAYRLVEGLNMRVWVEGQKQKVENMRDLSARRPPKLCLIVDKAVGILSGRWSLEELKDLGKITELRFAAISSSCSRIL